MSLRKQAQRPRAGSMLRTFQQLALDISNEPQMRSQHCKTLYNICNAEEELKSVADAIISSGLLASLVTCLQDKDLAIADYVARILTQISFVKGSDCTKKLIEAGTVPCLVRLAQTPNFSVAAHAVCVVGNIAGEDVSCRNTVLAANALDAFVTLSRMLTEKCEFSNIAAEPVTCTDLMEELSYATFNIMSSEPEPSLRYAVKAVEFIKYALNFNVDAANDACRVLMQIIKSRPEIELEQPLLDNAVKLFQKQSNLSKFQFADSSDLAVFDLLNDIVAGEDDELIQKVINAGFLKTLSTILTRKLNSVGGEDVFEFVDRFLHQSMDTLHNILFGTDAHRQAFFQENLHAVLARAMKLKIQSRVSVSYTKDDSKSEINSIGLTNYQLSLLVTGYFRQEMECSPYDVASVACLYFGKSNLCKKAVSGALNAVVVGLATENIDEQNLLMFATDIPSTLVDLLTVKQDRKILNETIKTLNRVYEVGGYFEVVEPVLQKLLLIEKSAKISDSGKNIIKDLIQDCRD